MQADCGGQSVVKCADRYFKEAAVSSRIFVLSFCLLGFSALAAEPETAAAPAPAPTPVTFSEPAIILSPEQRAEYVARAEQLTKEAEQRRADNDKRYAEAKIECWKKFLVSACLEDARQVHRKEIIAIQKVEREARALDREVRRHDAAEHAALREAENARKDAENEAKAAKYRAEREAEEARRAAKRK